MTPSPEATDRFLKRVKTLARERSCAFVYVIGREEGPVKVGISSNPRKRLSQIKTACPFAAELLHVEPMLDRNHARYHEEMFHGVYAEKRLNGEWFDLDADLAIEQVENSLETEAYFYVRRELERGAQ